MALDPELVRQAIAAIDEDLRIQRILGVTAVTHAKEHMEAVGIADPDAAILALAESNQLKPLSDALHHVTRLKRDRETIAGFAAEDGIEVPPDPGPGILDTERDQ